MALSVHNNYSKTIYFILFPCKVFSLKMLSSVRRVAHNFFTSQHFFSAINEIIFTSWLIKNGLNSCSIFPTFFQTFQRILQIFLSIIPRISHQSVIRRIVIILKQNRNITKTIINEKINGKLKDRAQQP